MLSLAMIPQPTPSKPGKKKKTFATLVFRLFYKKQKKKKITVLERYMMNPSNVRKLITMFIESPISSFEGTHPMAGDRVH